jgi:hypothetical protein
LQGRIPPASEIISSSHHGEVKNMNGSFQSIIKARRRAIHTLTPSSSQEQLVSDANVKRHDQCKGSNIPNARLIRFFIFFAFLIWSFTQPLRSAAFKSEMKTPTKVPVSEPPFRSVGPCLNLTFAKLSPHTRHRPVWIASYPGSGAEMVRELVEVLTGGVIGGSVYTKRDPPFLDCRLANAATCKTHWPVLSLHSPYNFAPGEYDSNAIVLVRNPIRAFSSRWNHLWEVKTNTGGHTQQAPEKSWNQWFRKNWKTQVEKYQELIQTWTNNSFPHQVALILSYEDLISPLTGVWAAKQLAKVLKHANIQVIQGNDAKIKCLWKYTILEKHKQKRGKHKYIPGYTKQQKERVLEMLERELLVPLLMQQNEDTSTQNSNAVTKGSQAKNDLIRILQVYRNFVSNQTRIIDKF